MSLGTGAFKVGPEPECLWHSKEVSMATLQVGTIPECSRQLALSHWQNLVENTLLTPYLSMHRREGMGWEPEYTKISSKMPAWDAM